MSCSRIAPCLAGLIVALVAAAPASAHRLRAPETPTLQKPSLLRAPAPVNLRAGQPAVRFRSDVPTSWCDDTGLADGGGDRRTRGKKIVVIYALPRDRDDRFDLMADKLQGAAAGAARYVAVESGGRKTLRFDMGNECGPDYVSFHRLRLRRDVEDYQSEFSGEYSGDSRKLIRELRAYLKRQKLLSPDNRFLVFADFLQDAPDSNTNYPGGERGDGRLGVRTAFIYGPDNPDQTPDYDDIWAFYVAHELFHVFGAVQTAARNSDGEGHCTERYDLMCYDYEEFPVRCAENNSVDGDLASGGMYMPALDCGRNDYFNPDGPIRGRRGRRVRNTFDSPWLGSCEELSASCGPRG